MAKFLHLPGLRLRSNGATSLGVWVVGLCGVIMVLGSPAALAQTPTFSDAKSDARVTKYQPNQITRQPPKYDYTRAGQIVMQKRYPFFPEQNASNFQKYRYFENKRGVEHIEKGNKLKREPDEILSETQKQVLQEWGQPDYLRGPYKSTREDSVIEWCYYSNNRIFQWVNRTLVYEGELTDQDRAIITYGAPREVMVTQGAANTRRETWIWQPWILTARGSRERVMTFSNGNLIFNQESY